MTKGNDDWNDPYAELRKKAESLLRSNRDNLSIPPDLPSPDGILDMIHELQVHQAELELQNDELMAAREEYRVLEAEYRYLFESAPWGYLTLTPEGMVSKCNIGGGELLRSKATRLIGLPLESRFLGDSVPLFRSALSASACEGRAIGLELPVRTSEDEGCWLQVDVDSDCDAKGVVIRWRIALSDVTRRRRAEHELRESEERLRRLAGHLQQSQDQQLDRFSRELLDTLSQILVAIKMALTSSMHRAKGSQPVLESMMNEVIPLIDTALSTAKDLNLELYPALLNEIGLPEAVRWMVEQCGDRSGVPVSIVMDDGIPTIPKEESMAIYRIGEELLANATLHSHAGHIDVELAFHNDVLTLEVHDDGIGITNEEILDPESVGVAGIMERARYFGGSAVFSGRHGIGTDVRVQIPVTGAPV